MPINNPFDTYPNADMNGRHIPYEVARPAGLWIFQLAQNVQQSLDIQASGIEQLAIWSDSDVIAIYADSYPGWSYGTLIADACFCPAFSTTVIEANKASKLWLVPISEHSTGGNWTVTVQLLQAWKALGQQPQLGVAG